MEKGIRLYRDHLRLVLRTDNGAAGVRNSGVSQRGNITKFSEKSARRMSDYLSSCVAQYRFMGTLTVGEWENDGRSFKRSMEKYFNWKLGIMQRTAVAGSQDPESARAQESIFWFLEFQKRGAPHLHYFYTTPIHWFDCAARWSDAVNQPQILKSCSKFEKIYSGRRGSISYARKYAQKHDQKVVPEQYHNVGRFWGIRGMKDTVAAATTIRTARALDFIRNDVWSYLKELESSGQVRIFRWEDRPGSTITALGDQSLLDLGVMAMVDDAILADCKDRWQENLDKWNSDHIEVMRDGLRRQRWNARNG